MLHCAKKFPEGDIEGDDSEKTILKAKKLCAYQLFDSPPMTWGLFPMQVDNLIKDELKAQRLVLKNKE